MVAGRLQKVVPGFRAVAIALVIEYSIICALTSFFLGSTILVLCLLLLLGLMLVGEETLATVNPNKPWIRTLCMITALTALVIGGRNYHATFAPYWVASHGRSYQDVSPTATASGHADAGTILFKNGTMLDESKAIGLRLYGRTYCVAPIITRQAASTEAEAGAPGPAVQFWAVGLDCCEKRASFECDDAGDADAKGGVALYTPDDGEEALMRQILAPRIFRAGYVRAIEGATALYGLQSASSPVLVRWTKEPDFLERKWLIASILVWLVSTVVYGSIAVILWYSRNYKSRRGRFGRENSTLSSQGLPPY